MNIEICPSMLSADAARLGEELQSVANAGADAIHWDVMDGTFVDAITFGDHVIAAHRKITPLRFDVHLMVQNPSNHVERFVKAGADTIFIHPESCIHLHKVVSKIKSFGKQAGIALNPATSPECLRYCDADCVLVMSVNPGSSGQAFIPSQLEKIATIKKIFPNLKICVDGGISEKTISQCIAAGANSFVAGSFIFKHKNYTEAINRLR